MVLYLSFSLQNLPKGAGNVGSLNLSYISKVSPLSSTHTYHFPKVSHVLCVHINMLKCLKLTVILHVIGLVTCCGFNRTSPLLFFMSTFEHVTYIAVVGAIHSQMVSLGSCFWLPVRPVCWCPSGTLSVTLLSLAQVNDATKQRPKAEFCFGKFTVILSPICLHSVWLHTASICLFTCVLLTPHFSALDFWPVYLWLCFQWGELSVLQHTVTICWNKVTSMLLFKTSLSCSNITMYLCANSCVREHNQPAQLFLYFLPSLLCSHSILVSFLLHRSPSALPLFSSLPSSCFSSSVWFISSLLSLAACCSSAVQQ